MTITTLSAHKGNTWKIELDDSGELFFLHVSVVQRCGLRKGMTLTPQQWEQVQTAELSRKAYQYACFLLDNRGYSYQEMFRKLEPKYPQAVCFATVDRLAKYGQINDRAYAEQLATTPVRRSDHTMAKIRCAAGDCWKSISPRRWNRMRTKSPARF